jgi:hypothetical protein
MTQAIPRRTSPFNTKCEDGAHGMRRRSTKCEEALTVGM